MNVADIKTGIFQMADKTELYKYMEALAAAEFQNKIELTESEKNEIYRFIQDTDRALRSPTH